jgi:hypothetical protein
MPMVGVAVHDVLLWVPSEEETQLPRDARKLGPLAIIVLKEQQGEYLFPIFVGLPEGFAIIQPLAGVLPPRPMTHDLIARLLEASGNQVEKVAITTHLNCGYVKGTACTRSMPGQAMP